MENNQPKEKICSICGAPYDGYGNNAWPVNPGRCCNSCNTIVVTHRIRNVNRGESAYADPEWYAGIVETVTQFWRESKGKVEEHADGTEPLKGWESV